MGFMKKDKHIDPDLFAVFIKKRSINNTYLNFSNLKKWMILISIKFRDFPLTKCI
jgi:hypothetical protein